MQYVHKSGTFGSIGVSRQLLQNMFSMSTIYADTNIFASAREWYDFVM
jgi:hypothetical protein